MQMSLNFIVTNLNNIRTHRYTAWEHYVKLCILKLHDKTNPFLYILYFTSVGHMETQI